MFLAPNTRVRVTVPDLTAEDGVVVRTARVQFLHNDAFEQAYSWRLRPPITRYCVVFDDGNDAQQWVDARCLTTL